MLILNYVRKHRSLSLAQRGYRALEDEQPERALRIARKLEGLRYSAAFEIGALALAQQGDLRGAVRTLQRGVQLAPGSWLNWQLLGNYLSDLGRFDEATAAYIKALECPDVQVSSVRLNQCILASRRGRHADALVLSEQIDDPELKLHRVGVRATALRGLGRFDDAAREEEAGVSRSADG